MGYKEVKEHIADTRKQRFQKWNFLRKLHFLNLMFMYYGKLYDL